MSNEEKDEVLESPDLHFEPIINLPSVEVRTLEEDEEELLKLRAKLFRYDTDSEPREWKERGTGEVKILKHKDGICRILMRRDKTFKICANHLILPEIDLKPNCGNDRVWVWSTLSDFADEEPKPELLAIRFATAENALKFKEVIEEAKKVAANRQKGNESKTSEASDEVFGEEANEERDEVTETKDEEGPESPKTEGLETGVEKELEKLSVKPSGDE